VINAPKKSSREFLRSIAKSSVSAHGALKVELAGEQAAIDALTFGIAKRAANRDGLQQATPVVGKRNQRHFGIFFRPVRQCLRQRLSRSPDRRAGRRSMARNAP